MIWGGKDNKYVFKVTICMVWERQRNIKEYVYIDYTAKILALEVRKGVII